MNFCYHSPGSEPYEIHVWDVSTTGQSVQAPFTPSMPYPIIAEPNLQTHTQYVLTIHLANLNPCNEFQCGDLGSQNLEPDNPHSQQRELEGSQSNRYYDSDGDVMMRRMK